VTDLTHTMELKETVNGTDKPTNGKSENPLPK